MPKLTANSYGKSGVRLTKVVRNGKTHTLHEYDVAVQCTGDFAAAEKLFAEAAATPDFALADHALLQQAFSLARQNKHAESAALYARLVASFPQSAYVAEATAAAGLRYYQANQLDQAAQWLAKAAAALASLES